MCAPASALVVWSALAAAGGGGVDRSDLVRLIIEHSGDLEGKAVYVDMFGRPARGRFVSADEDELSVIVRGQPVAMPWDLLDPRKLVSIAMRAAGTVDELIPIARFAHARGLVEAADEALDRALELDASRKGDIDAVRGIIRPTEKAKTPAVALPFVSVKRASPARPRYQALPPASWQCVGPGGGGAMYTPTISPHDPKVGIITCDMGGIYLTRDGGRHWRVLPHMHLGHGVAFSSVDPNVIFVGLSGKLYRSADGGATWKPVTADRQYPTCSAWDVLVDPDDGGAVWVAFGWGNEAGKPVNPANRFRVERSRNGGLSFTECSNGLPHGSGMVKKLALDRRSPVGVRTLYAATTGGFYRSRDAGGTWEKAGSGLPRQDLRDVVTLYDGAAGKTTVLVSLEPGGIWRSEDGGDTFVPSGRGISDRDDGSGPVVEALAASWSDPRTVYAAGSHIWKSTDGGRSWQDVYPDAQKLGGWLCVFFPWAHDHARGIGCNPKEPGQVWITGDMQFWASNDGCATLVEMNSHPVPDGVARMSFKGSSSWRRHVGSPLFYDGGGLEVTFCYEVIPNPLLRDVFYTCFADMGGWRTEDAGRSWTYNLGIWNTGIKSEWRNSCYEIAVDRRRPGRIYGVFSGRHNLPGADITGAGRYNIGGAAVSNNGGKSWTPFENAGLPERPCTSVVIDRRSGEENILYVAVYGVGVFRSTDSGRKWAEMSAGLPRGARAWRLRQAPDNVLHLACTNGNPGGLWKYDEEKARWSRLDAGGRFTDVRDLVTGEGGFLAVAVAGTGGGVYVSHDSGSSWKTLFDSAVNTVARSPDGRFWFAGGRRGLFRSLDGGTTWKKVEDFPFRSVNDVTLNPRNPGELWVGTAGCGVFKGPAVPAGH